MKFVKNTKYYEGVVYEWNLPTGSSCPFALECKVTVDRHTGKFDIAKGQYRCYASGPERFPAVREHRWRNFDYVRSKNIPVLPKDCKSLRIHASGDFFNQWYFDMWLDIAMENPDVEMWAYTKSITYWLNRIDRIPSNLILTASRGGKQDELIDRNGLKNVTICSTPEDVPYGLPIDTNDHYARIPEVNFALVDNFKRKK
jgi:hypothetical protein